MIPANPDFARAPSSASGTRQPILDAAQAISWGAVLAGAVGAAALSLILMVLGVGLGLGAVSPWESQGIQASTVAWSAILWLTLTQVAASAMGGYLAGRLRTRWHAVRADEVYFRDTAHGFLAWAAASVLTAAVLGSAIGSIANTGMKTGSTTVGRQAAQALPLTYWVESLFRTEAPSVAAVPRRQDGFEQARLVPISEVDRIYANALRSGGLMERDLRYVGQLISQRTGLTQADAELRAAITFARIQDAQTTAKEGLDKARKVSAYTALWAFIAMLLGAFVASWTATLGGRQRDQ